MFGLDHDAFQFFVFLVLLLAVYMIPAIVATRRNHPRAGAIMALNLFFGWTFIVWIACFIWANVNQRPDLVAIDDDKTCPFCAERIKRDAVFCRYCNRDLPA